MTRAAQLHRLIPEVEERIIVIETDAEQNPRTVKVALQRLCDLLEAGKLLRDTVRISKNLRSLAWHADVKVRRWAYKAIALSKDEANLEIMIGRVRTPDPDPENATWAIAAIFAIASNAKLSELIEKRSLPLSGTALIAGALYNRAFLTTFSRKSKSINIMKADPLTLKWVALLEGYDQLEPGLLHPRLLNKEVLPKLNTHDDPQVSEYSVWAIHKNKAYSSADLVFAPSDCAGKAPNIRRWIYRAFTKSEAALRGNLDFIISATRDPEAEAREGLALGLQPYCVPELAGPVLRWYGQEPKPELRILLLELMARHSDSSADYRELATFAYQDPGVAEVEKLKLRRAAEETSLFAEFQRIDSERRRVEAAASQQPSLFDTPPLQSAYDRPVIANYGTIHMSNNKQSFSTDGGPLNIGAAISGDHATDIKSLILNSGVKASDGDVTALSQLVAALSSGSLEHKPESKAAVAAIRNALSKPEKSQFESALDALKKLKDVSGIATDVVEAINKAIGVVTGWLS